MVCRKGVFFCFLVAMRALSAFQRGGVSSIRSCVAVNASSGKKKKKQMQQEQERSEFSWPRLVVFDLDNTVWNPELYMLGRRPVANKDIYLCEGSAAALRELWEAEVAGAVASRTHRGDLAEELLDVFEVSPGLSLSRVLPHREIYTGSKRKHFQNLQKKTGVPYSEMLFFDDWTQNLADVTQLGVLSIHTPRGLTTNLWRGGLRAYAALKQQNTTFMGRMLTSADLTESFLP